MGRFRLVLYSSKQKKSIRHAQVGVVVDLLCAEVMDSAILDEPPRFEPSVNPAGASDGTPFARRRF